MIAAEYGYVPVVAMLLSYNAQVDCRDLVSNKALKCDTA